MSREYQEPIVRKGDGAVAEEVMSHPAFGQIECGRITGRTNLYGSDYEHHQWMKVAIHVSELNRGISQDWYFPKRTVVEVYLSEAQWATFLSSTNVGSGVPCTFRFRSDQDHQGFVPSLPVRNRGDVARDEIAAKLEGTLTQVDATTRKVEDSLKGLSKKARDEALSDLYRLRQELASNIPWRVKEFDKLMEETVEKAKVEAHAYINNVVQRAGLAALTDATMPVRLIAGPVLDAEVEDE